MYQFKYTTTKEEKQRDLKRDEFLKKRSKDKSYCFFPSKPLILLDKYTRWKKIADTLNLSKEAKARLNWIIYYEIKTKKNVSLTCRHYGLARKTFYKWYNRFEDGKNFKGLENQDRAPKHVRQKEITPLQEYRIIILRKRYIRESKTNIAIYYKQEYLEEISSWKVQYVIQKHKLYYNRKQASRTAKKKKRAIAKKRIADLKKKRRTGFLIQIDTITIWYNGMKYYILTAIDVFSKIAFARFYKNHSSVSAADFLLRLNYLFQDKIENIQTDNGSEFAKYFEKACKQLKIDHYFSRNRTPKDLACLESFNGIIKKQYIQIEGLNPNLSVANKKLTEWIIHNDFKRPHSSLNNLTPFQFHQKYHKVLPMSSSSATGLTCLFKSL